MVVPPCLFFEQSANRLGAGHVLVVAHFALKEAMTSGAEVQMVLCKELSIDTLDHIAAYGTLETGRYELVGHPCGQEWVRQQYILALLRRLDEALENDGDTERFVEELRTRYGYVVN